MTFPTPKHSVSLEKIDGKHVYVVQTPYSLVRLPGVTGFLSIIGGDKTNRILGWGIKESVSRYTKALMDRLEGFKERLVLVNEQWIKDVEKDAKKRPKKVLDEAGEVGTLIHTAIDAHITGAKVISIDSEAKRRIEPIVRSFIDWQRGRGVEFLSGDRKVASLTHGYGGSLDALARIGSKRILIDWKSSSGAYDSMALQLAAYDRALEETYGIKCDEAWIVRISKTEPFVVEEYKVRDLDRSFAAFIAAKQLCEYMSQPHLIRAG